jgi:hypothetical protein
VVLLLAIYFPYEPIQDAKRVDLMTWSLDLN